MVRLSRALGWHDYTAGPAPGADTNLLAETLLERAERMSSHHDHGHGHGHGHNHDFHFHSLRLRRERSCHDIPIKEVWQLLIYSPSSDQTKIFLFCLQTTTVYTLQRRVRVLREQLQKKDLQ